jgi:competence protein ComEC
MTATDVFILNVGSGSCTVVSHPSGRKTMIDINNGRELRAYEYEALSEGRSREAALREAARYEQALTNPIDWYRRVFGKELWRFILSHPDADHMAGIRCLFDGHIEPWMFWDLGHTKPMKPRSEYKNEQAYEDAEVYYHWRGQPPNGVPHRIGPEAFESDNFWAPDQIEILSPSHALVDDRSEVSDWNNLSYALRINHAGASVLIAGDVEQIGWNWIASACKRRGVDLKTDVLVASHHGRRTGYPDEGVLDLIDPSAVIVSAGAIPEKESAIRRYRDNVGHVFSTRQLGSLLVRMYDSGEINIATGVDTFEELQTVLSLKRRLVLRRRQPA